MAMKSVDTADREMQGKRRAHPGSGGSPGSSPGAAVEPLLSLVVPTLGRSPLLDACLRSLRAEADALRRAGKVVELVLVVPAGFDGTSVEALDDVDRVIGVERSGFAAANNRAFLATRGTFWATVNDDAVIEPGWTGRLLEVLGNEPDIASVQGLNLGAEGSAIDESTIDGAGIAWNRYWQAVQIGHGLAANSIAGRTSIEVFGVSATAAIYRRSAVEAVATEATAGGPFDERLWAYYEDVDLAWRLRAAGWRAWVEVGARARHAGSTTGRTLSHGGRALIHGNRHLVLASHLGRSFWPRWPWLAFRDVLDCARLLMAGDGAGASGVLAGLLRAAGRLPGHAHLGSPDLPIPALRPYFAPAPGYGSSVGDSA